MMTDEMVKATAEVFCSNCHNEIEDGACSNCGTPFEHSGRVYCDAPEHYCEECYEEEDEEE
jgi:predicted amidophosphoribosyltransferase